MVGGSELHRLLGFGKHNRSWSRVLLRYYPYIEGSNTRAISMKWIELFKSIDVSQKESNNIFDKL